MLTALLFILVAIAFITLAVIIFYHFARYSLIGDLSKRIFVLYILAGVTVLAGGLTGVVLNHLFNGP